MRYKPELGIFGNIKRIYEEGTKTNITVSNNQVREEQFELDSQSNQVEAVIDEYNAVIESST